LHRRRRGVGGRDREGGRSGNGDDLAAVGREAGAEDQVAGGEVLATVTIRPVVSKAAPDSTIGAIGLIATEVTVPAAVALGAEVATAVGLKSCSTGSKAGWVPDCVLAKYVGTLMVLPFRSVLTPKPELARTGPASCAVTASAATEATETRLKSIDRLFIQTPLESRSSVLGLGQRAPLRRGIPTSMDYCRPSSRYLIEIPEGATTARHSRIRGPNSVVPSPIASLGRIRSFPKGNYPFCEMR
jgi:hypothetical protein